MVIGESAFKANPTHIFDVYLLTIAQACYLVVAFALFAVISVVLGSIWFIISPLTALGLGIIYALEWFSIPMFAKIHTWIYSLEFAPFLVNTSFVMGVLNLSGLFFYWGYNYFRKNKVD